MPLQRGEREPVAGDIRITTPRDFQKAITQDEAFTASRARACHHEDQV